jgi:hypothetical protein
MNASKGFRKRKTAITIEVSRSSSLENTPEKSYRANAKIIRLLVVMTLNVAKIRHTSGSLDFKLSDFPRASSKLMMDKTNMRRQIPPAMLFVACIKICSKGPAAELMTSSILPATKSRTMRKMAPVKVPMPTQMTMILGPSKAALGISDLNGEHASRKSS